MRLDHKPYGILYVVATPLGNLQDMTFRAVDVLKSTDRILCEDTRHSALLLKHFGIVKPLLSLHNFNELERINQVLDHLKSGENLALISDAGTPLISDPGYPLVRAMKDHGVTVVPIPGACAAIAALSAAGLPTDRFVFEGFLPAKLEAKKNTLASFASETRTIIFYESPYRVLETLQAIAETIGGDRKITVAKELTKLHELIRLSSADDQFRYFSDHPDVVKGEFVLLVEGRQDIDVKDHTVETDKVLNILLDELPLKQAVKLASLITGERKNELYEKALLKKGNQDHE